MSAPKYFAITLLTVLISAFTVLGATEQAACPVMGGEINKEVFVDHEGQRVYFCCPGCKTEFLKDPAAYLKKMKDSGVTLAKAPDVQATCPVSGKPVNKNVFVEHNGKKVYFCCEKCAEAFKKDPAKYCENKKADGTCCGKCTSSAANCPQNKKSCCGTK